MLKALELKAMASIDTVDLLKEVAANQPAFNTSIKPAIRSNITQKVDLTLSSFLADLLQQPTLLTVHSIFKQGINLKSEDYGLIYLSTINKKGLAEELNDSSDSHTLTRLKVGQNLSAIGLQLEGIDFKELKEGLAIGQLVKITAQSMTLYKGSRPLILSINQLKLVDLSLFKKQVADGFCVKSQAEPKVLPLNATLISALIANIQSAGQLEHSGFKLIAQLEDLRQTFYTDQPDYPMLFKQLIGLGLGLTPSGDDCLLGFLMMERFFAKNSKHIHNLSPLLKGASTTDVSLAYFQAFMKGYANSTWLDLYQALAQNESDLMFAAIENISRTGNTSGSDSLFGCLTYLENFK